MYFCMYKYVEKNDIEAIPTTYNFYIQQTTTVFKTHPKIIRDPNHHQQFSENMQRQRLLFWIITE